MGTFIKLFDTHTEYQTYINGNTKVLPNVSYCEDNNEVHYNPIETRIVATFNVTIPNGSIPICYSDSANEFSKIEIDGVVQPNVVSYYTFDTTGEHTVKYKLYNKTTIGTNAFKWCSNLTSVTIPNGVTTIGDSAFYGCTGLTSVSLPNTITSIGNNAFNNCSGLTSVGGIGSGASIEIPNGVTSIGDRVFYYCGHLTSVTIPNTITSIGDYAFYETGLTSVTIGSGVTTIGIESFSNCSRLKNIISLATTAPTIDNTTFRVPGRWGTLTVPTGSTGYDVWMGSGNYYLGSYYWTKVEQ